MAFKQPKQWQILKRHPLSAEYEDISGQEWQNLVASITGPRGFDKRKPIVMLDGEIYLLRGSIVGGTNTRNFLWSKPRLLPPKKSSQRLNSNPPLGEIIMRFFCFVGRQETRPERENIGIVMLAR